MTRVRYLQKMPTEERSKLFGKERLADSFAASKYNSNFAWFSRSLNYSSHPTDQISKVFMVALTDVFANVLKEFLVKFTWSGLAPEALPHVVGSRNFFSRQKYDAVELLSFFVFEPPLTYGTTAHFSRGVSHVNANVHQAITEIQEGLLYQPTSF